MRYGSREWFLQTPDEARKERRRRRRVELSGLTVIESVNEEEVAWTWANMRPEEKQEACEAGGGEAAHRAAAFKAERSFAIYHGDALLAIATVEKIKGVGVGRSSTMDISHSIVDLDLRPRPIHFLSMERTVAALERGHRFTWLRAYGPLGRWIGGQYPDGLWTVTPTDLPRALDVYRHAGAERTGETVKVGGREYWVLKIS